MPENIPWRILIVDDDIESCELTKEYLEQGPLSVGEAPPAVDFITDFTKALEKLEIERYDLLILDVRLQVGLAVPDEQIGIGILNEIKQRRFIPVVFYTALPHRVNDLQTALIRVVSKAEQTSFLLAVIREIFQTRLPSVNRALIRHLETVQRDYMWEFVAGNWAALGDTPDRASLAYLLARRLAVSLSGPGMKQLLDDLGVRREALEAEGKVHPMKYYVMPPIENSPLTGDLYCGTSEQYTGYRVVMTPSCDLTPRDGKVKADLVLLAKCLTLKEQEEYKNWVAGNRSRKTQKPLEALIGNNRKNNQQPERFHYLPGAMSLPDLLVDFQALEVVTYERLNDPNNLKRLASLDSPFAECLLTRFTRYYGRIGTPDLDTNIVMAKLMDNN